MRESKLYKPFQKKDGWYFYFRRRDGVVCKAGPEPTEQILQRIIDSRQKCDQCNAFAFHDARARVQPEDQVPLCMDCERDFVQWHKNEEGVPPPELPLAQ